MKSKSVKVSPEHSVLSVYLFDACALLFVGIVGQFEVFSDVVIPSCLLDLNLLCELKDFLLQLGNSLLGTLGVWGAILAPGK